MCYDFQFPSGDFAHNKFDPKARSSVPEWVLNRLGIDFFHDVVHANLWVSEDSDQSDDDDLQYLRGLPELRFLVVQGTQPSDTTMCQLANLKKLEYLYLYKVSAVTDEGIEYLRDLKNLRHVHINSSQITDRSLALFARLPKLEGAVSPVQSSFRRRT